MKTGKIVHILLAVSIVVYLTGHILLNNNKIQQEAAVHVVGIASAALGTDVDAARVQFTYPFGITIDDLTVYDMQHDTLAHAASLSLRLKPLKLLKKKLSITSIRVNSPGIRLYKDDPDAQPNYAFLLDLFGSSDEPMSFRANSVLIRNGSIHYDIRSSEWTDSLFNPSHIGISSLTANLSLKSISADSIAVIVRKFTFAEQSGFALTKAQGAVNVGKDHADLSGFVFSNPNGEFKANRLSADAGFASKINGLPDMDFDISATLTGSDFKAFYPKLASMTAPIDLSLKGSGRNGNLNVNALYAQAPDSVIDLGMSGTLYIDTAFTVKGCSFAEAHGSFSEELPQWIKCQFGGFGLTIPKQLASLGDGSFKINLDNRDGNTASTLDISSQAGSVLCQINGQNDVYTGNLTASDIDLRTITGNRDLGNCSFTAYTQLQKQDNGFSGHFNGRIGSIRYKRYNYRGINIKGSFDPELIISDLKFADRNGAITMDAGIGIGRIPFYSVSIDADSLNLSAYHLVDRDSMSLTATVTANIVGNNVDDMTGKISVDSLYYADKTGDWSMDNLTVAVGQYNDIIKVATLYSDFINVSLIGNYRISQIPASLAKACSDALPTIGKMVGTKLHTGSYAKSSNNFAVDVNLENADFMQKVFHSPVSVNKPAHLQMTFVDSRKIYSGNLSVPELSFNGQNITDANINLESSDGTCSVDIAGRYGEKEADPTDIKANFLASKNIVHGNYSWNNKTGSMSGTATTHTQFTNYDRRRGLQSMSAIDTTDITVYGTIWDLSVAQILTDRHKVTITDFSAGNNDQYLYANGTVSADSSDVFVMQLRNINLGQTLSTLHINNSAQIYGIASGQVFVAGVLANPAFSGSFGIDDFQFMDSYHGHFAADCRWNRHSRQVELQGNMVDEGISSTALTGVFIPQTKYLDLNLEADHTDLHFLNTWTKVAFREISGRAVGNLHIYGNIPRLDMEGEAILEDGLFVQDAVNTALKVKRDTLWFEPGKMLFKDVEFYDEKGHDGILTCILTHDKFTHWGVDMTADVADMLVFYQPKNEKSDIFASVYAEGSMSLRFDETTGLAISVDARTAPGTRIGYNPSSGSVADYNFLTIVDRGTVSIDEEAVRRIIPEKTRKNKHFSLDLNVECSEDALIELSMPSLNGFFRGNGNIAMKFTPKDGPVINGIYNLSYGQCSLSIEDIIRKNFTLMEGSYVRFNGSPIDTEINLQTYHNVHSASIYDLDPSASSNNKVHVRCLMGITGNVTDPRVTFDIDMPSGTPQEKAILASATTTEEQRNNQLIYLLALGRFYTEDTNSDRMTPSAVESIVNNTVSGQINNLLSQVMDNDKISLSSNVTATSYLTNDATNLSNKELEGILEAHLLNNRLLVNGNFGYRENTINNTSNFIGDFEFKYLLIPDKRGKGISIKGYNKANDKYFSKTTLTTQGVGLVLEKDF
ncbi:MAG: translocation/assembly module TamB [Bacteroidaceae bacterium]|nr:translocation/assembly module TamB [Bacteroidaceae bacterium]